MKCNLCFIQGTSFISGCSLIIFDAALMLLALLQILLQVHPVLPATLETEEFLPRKGLNR